MKDQILNEVAYGVAKYVKDRRAARDHRHPLAGSIVEPSLIPRRTYAPLNSIGNIIKAKGQTIGVKVDTE